MGINLFAVGGQKRTAIAAGTKKPLERGGEGNYMFSNLLKTVVGIALLPVTIVVDVVTFPWIANEDREAATPILAKAVIENLVEAVAKKN